MTHLERPVCIRALASGTPAEWGPCIWGELHEVVGKIPCPECRPKAVREMRGFHDAHNILDDNQPPSHPADLLYLKSQIDEAVKRCHVRGQCKTPIPR